MVELPAVLIPPEHEPAVYGTEPAEGYRVRLIVVEDNPDAAESLAMLLRMLGHSVTVVHDGAAAIELAWVEVPDLMLIDIGLPGMSGYEVASRIRQNADLKQVALVALTGYARDEDRQNAWAAGFHHHLVKPLDVATLQEIVTRFGPPKSVRRELRPITDLQSFTRSWRTDT